MTPALTARSVHPELLDTMPPDAPAARASRRDLRRINALMGQARIQTSLLRRYVDPAPKRIVEIGGGDGRFTLAVARAMAPRWPGVALTLVDAQPLVSSETRARIAALGWTVDVVTADVFDWLGQGAPQDLAVANLVLHHFADDALAELLSRLFDRASILVATEPRRSGPALLAARSVGAIGANAVTRHDAPASVRAGFTGGELGALWPGAVRFEGLRGPFTHAFVAASRS